MGKVTRGVFVPDEANAAAYEVLFAEYRLLHDYFGRGDNEVMHRLKAIRREATVRRGAGAEVVSHDRGR
jgi:L-ribulokinase